MNPPDDKPAFGPKHPFEALLVERRLLGAPTSEKSTHLIAFSLAPGGPSYACGDTFGILPQNSADSVSRFLERTRLSGGEAVVVPRSTEKMPLGEALRSRFHFEARPTPAAYAAAAFASSSPLDRETLAQIAALPSLAFQEYVRERRMSELFAEFPSVRMNAETLAGILPPLNPRLYSAASTPRATPDRVEFAVAKVAYALGGRSVRGVASGYLCEDAIPGETRVPVFPAKGVLRLPEPGRDLVMIGPGTGIAPFRAFLKDRELTGAKGRNWLFYGHRREDEDFYFAGELRGWESSGLLTHLSLAWSRQGGEKRYVQHLLREEAAELWKWLEGGALLCICGNKEHMARDVEAALADMATERGACGTLPEEKAAWLRSLKTSKRLLEDVY